MNLVQARLAATAAAATLFLAAPTATIAQEGALDRAIEAVGGAEALSALDSFVVEGSGRRGTIDEGATPGQGTGLENEYTSVTTVDITGDRLRVGYAVGPTEFSGPREGSEIIVGDSGFADGMYANFAPPGTVPLLSDRVASIRTHQQLLNPHLLLRDAVADRSIAKEGPGTIEIAHGSTPITLWVDEASGLITQATTVESDPLRRDVEVAVTYEGWADAGNGLLFPVTVDVNYDTWSVQEESRTVSAGAEIDDADFAIPEGLELSFDADLASRGDLNHQYLQSFAAGGFPLDGIQPDIVATEVISPGVFHLTGGTHHSMAIVQDDGVVIVEAPLEETRTEAILAWLESQVPDKPVTHIVQSHHHSDHSGGLRSMAGTTGATVVAGDAAVPFYEAQVFTANSEIVPDGVDASSIAVEGVGNGPLTIDSGTNAVTVHPFPNPHAEDYVLVEANGALWIVDIFSPQTGAPLPPFIVDVVDGLGLEISHVVGGHGGVASWEELIAG